MNYNFTCTYLYMTPYKTKLICVKLDDYTS